MLYTLAQRLYPRVLAQKNRDPDHPKQKIKDPWTIPKATILANMKGDLPSIYGLPPSEFYTGCPCERSDLFGSPSGFCPPVQS